MEKKLIFKWMMGKMLLICVSCFAIVSTTSAQDSVSDKVEQAKLLFSVQLSTSTNEQISSTIRFFDQCSKAQKDAILSYMVQAITDSLKAENKSFAMNYIDYYRLIASPDNEYLGSLVMAEGRYFYDLMDASKIEELSNFINGISSTSNLDYSTEMAELNTMKDNLLHGIDRLLGYWVIDDDKSGYPLLYMKVENVNGQLIVSLSMGKFPFNAYNKTQNPDYIKRREELDQDYQNNKIKMFGYIKRSTAINEEFNIEYKDYFTFKGELSSLECVQSTPNSLSFFWSSQKLKKGNEYLATGLRSGVRTFSNEFIGELARTNTYGFGTSVVGSLGVLLGEAVLNAFIDGVSESKNTIRTISSTLTLTGKNSMDADMYVNYYHASTEGDKIDMDSTACKVKFIRYDLNDSYIYNNIVFYDWDKKQLRRYELLSKKEEKQYRLQHPEAKIKGSSLSNAYWKRVFNYNKEQYAKLREYNSTH